MEILENKLQIKNLTKQIDKKVILNNLSFDVKNGEIISIIGPSGCGKTTLLMSLIGLYQLEKGKIFLDGENITEFDADKRKMGLIFQDYSLFENMNVLNNVAYALKFSKDKIKKEKRYELATDLLKKLGLEKHLYKFPDQLSGGERQRVAIARALVLSSEIILFDEPMSALDVESKMAFKELILDIKEKFNSTMIYVTHDQEDAFTIADRVMIMKDGKIVQIDTPQKYNEKSANSFVRKFVVDSLLKRANIINGLLQTEGLKK